MDLTEVVEKYLAVVGSFGRPAALSDFGLERTPTEQVFSTFDKDYHISRYFHFASAGGTAYKINGFDHTHVSIDAEIQSIL